MFCAVLTAMTPLLGGYLRAGLQGEAGGPRTRRAPGVAAARRAPERGQGWKRYARSVLVFSVLLRPLLPDPAHADAAPVEPDSTSASGTWTCRSTRRRRSSTNTNWQFYAGETTLSYFSQMAGLAVQNFVSAGVGIAVAGRVHPRPGVALGRVDRRLLRRLHAHGALRAAPAVGDRRARARVAGRRADARQAPRPPSAGLASRRTFAHGPVAGQEAIKLLGTNGGGFFNVNSAMPFENPTWLSNFVEMLAILASRRR